MSDGNDKYSTAARLDVEAYRALYEHGPYGVLFTSPNGRIHAANPAACRILRLTEADICARGRQGLADATDDRWSGMLAERAQTGQGQGVGRMIRGDGVPIEVELQSRLFTDASGEQRSCTVISDVTARVQLERELVDSKARLAEAEQMAGIGSWEWNLAEGHIAWSNGLLEIFGLSREGFETTYDRALGRVYPDDRERVRRAIDDAITKRSSFTVEFRAIRADGRVRVLRSFGEVAVDDHGEPTRLVGVAHDITEATQARDALRNASVDLERTAVELQALALRTDGEGALTNTASLTARQMEILRLIAQGLTTAAVADRLVVSNGTVKWHVKQILARTGSANRAEAVARVLGRSSVPAPQMRED
jgi:PAS domain S-box-containing protein